MCTAINHFRNQLFETARNWSLFILHCKQKPVAIHVSTLMGKNYDFTISPVKYVKSLWGALFSCEKKSSYCFAEYRLRDCDKTNFVCVMGKLHRYGCKRQGYICHICFYPRQLAKESLCCNSVPTNKPFINFTKKLFPLNQEMVSFLEQWNSFL